MIRILYLCFLTVLLSISCSHPAGIKKDFKNEEIARVIAAMTGIMVHDVTNPPLAARFFSYACLAGYEVIAQNAGSRYKSLHQVLNDYPSLKKPDTIQGYSTHLSALLAMIETAEKLQPSGKLMTNYQATFLDSLRQSGMDEAVIENSLRYAQAVSRDILSYAKADRYNRISNYPRYTPSRKEGSWYPTPPAYIAAIEPNFNTVRPFTLDSATQYTPPPPVAFSKEKNSPFYRQLQENYRFKASSEQEIIAAFWDCNPFAVEDKGHLLVGIKKISPGAHWLGITGIACSKAGKSFEETLLIHTLVSVGLMDAFICCWDEKYRSNRIRPETAIRNLIDSKWQPFLQTPPFPEYLSGHSTISASSATILSHFFGENFNYTDTVEVMYGLPARSFPSFKAAAEEAAISRFYGGIHFMDAVNNGLVVGEKVGWRVIERTGFKPGR